MLVAMFVTVWLSLIIPGIQAQQPPDGATIFVIDLAFVLPLLAIVAVMLIRHQPMGALLAPTVLIKVATLDCSVLLGTLIAPFFSQSLDWGSVGVYAVMDLGSAALAIFVLMHVDLGEHADGNIRWMCVRSNGQMLNGRLEQRDLGHLQAAISRKMQISHKHRAGLSVRTRLF